MSADLTQRLLDYLDKHNQTTTLELAEHFHEDHQKVIGALKSIQTHENVVNAEQQNFKRFELTAEGRAIVDNGSHEAVLFNAIPAEGIAQAELMKLGPNAKVGFSKAMSCGWIQVDKSAGVPVVKRKVDAIVDHVRNNLERLHKNEATQLTDKEKEDFKKRKLLQEIVVKTFVLTKGSAFTTTLEKFEADLTCEMLANGSYRDLKFKAYNLDALGAPPDGGNLHPLLKVRTEFRQIFLEMGFSEMNTCDYVESSFWNFDALFQPQQHPARDAHDTFFLTKPATAHVRKLCDFDKSVDAREKSSEGGVNRYYVDKYVDKVKRVHSARMYGSIGHQYFWRFEEAQKNVLRTHTTASSARMLYKLAQDCRGMKLKPAKMFSIDRVFRNETLDATHLAEFHQIEGVVADYNLNLGHLIGILHEFFAKLGITKLKFKPAYNPYTEPSMEIFSYHDGLAKWMEVGNSGMFRPEMLLPMGFTKGVNVLGFGLSLERPTMIKYKFNNIRDLVGPKVDLNMVRTAPVCRLDQ